MKKLLILVSAFALIFTSCSTESSSSSSTTGTKLTQIIETFNDGSTETINFEYNGDKIVSYSWDSSLQDETLFTYTGDLITKEEHFYDDGDPLEAYSEVIEYEYDINGRLIKSTLTDNTYYGTFITVDDFTYNANGTVTFSTTENSSLYATGTIYFNGNQPYKKEKTEILDPTWTVNTVEENFYDDKVNPMNSVIGFSKIEIACPTYHYGFYGMPNNVIEIKQDGVSKETSTYTYNSNNMPATEVYIDNDNSDYNSTSQYIYN